MAEAETNEPNAWAELTIAAWPALKTVMPASFIMTMLPDSTWLYNDFPTMLTMKSLPRAVMVAFGVNSLKASFLCWPITPLTKRNPPLNMDKMILLFSILLGS